MAVRQQLLYLLKITFSAGNLNGPKYHGNYKIRKKDFSLVSLKDRLAICGTVEKDQIISVADRGAIFFQTLRIAFLLQQEYPFV
jgi:hypothetical protein